MDEQQGAAGVHQGGDRTLGVTDELLPDPFAQRDFGEFPCLRSQDSISARAKAGLVSVPPTGLGKSA